MGLSDTINDMYNAGAIQSDDIFNKETVKLITDSSECMDRSFYILYRIVSLEKSDIELYDKYINRLSLFPLVTSPVRFLNNKTFFVQFVKSVRTFGYNFKESYMIVADIYFKCFGGNLFAKDDKQFDQYSDDFDKFMKYKENHKL